MLLPMTLVLGILIIGLFFLFLTKRQRTGKVFILIGTLFLGLVSYDAISGSIVSPLEYKYPPILNTKGIQPVKWIVVLGGGHVSDPKLPVTSQIDIEKAQAAFHEYLGLVWAKLRGAI